MAIYPGGEINLDHSGYKPVEVVEYNDEIGDLQGTDKNPVLFKISCGS